MSALFANAQPLHGLIGGVMIGLAAALMLLGAGGAVLALNSAGTTESQGMVGLVGGVLLWAAAAQQAFDCSTSGWPPIR